MSNGKHSFLTPDRLEKLNEAGFVWSVRKDGPEDVVKTESVKMESEKEENPTSPSVPLKEEAEVDEQPRECDGELENPDKKDEEKTDSIIPQPDQVEHEENSAPSVEATVAPSVEAAVAPSVEAAVDTPQVKAEETKQDEVLVAV